MNKAAKDCVYLASQLLHPAGFSKGANMFIRHRADTVQAIDIQFSQSIRGEFTINLGWHFSGLPSMITLRATDWNDVAIPDFFMHERVGILKNARDEWFCFRIPHEELYPILKAQLSVAVSLFEELSHHIGDADSLYASLTPDLLAKTVHTEKPAGILGTQTIPACWKLFHGWHPDLFNVFAFVISFAKRRGDIDKAQKITELADEKFDALECERLHGILKTV